MMRKLLAGIVVGGWVAFSLMLFSPAQATSNECAVFYNHSGHIPGSYDYAEFYEDGQLVTTVQTFGEDVFVNPAGWDADEDWDQVNKCDYTTTTTLPEETTTTVQETTTTTVQEATTTTQSTTSTTAPTTTSTTVATTIPEAPTTTIQVTTTAPEELPFTGPAGVVGLLVAGLAAVGIGTVLVREFRSE